VFGKRNQVVDGAEKLRGVAFFEGFTDAELDRVAALADDVEAEPGAVLTEQGRVGQECFVVLEGHASVYVGDEYVAALGPGSMVGEMSLFDHRPRVATVVADDAMHLIAFDTKRFRTLLAEMPKAGERVNQLLAARIRANRSR
jgi:CRP/FNR family transcriptional regulator, cyclic AMP receptor protein